MQRRQLFQNTALLLAGGAVAACAGQFGRAAPAELGASDFHSLRRYHHVGAFGEIAVVELGAPSLPAALFLHGFPLNAFQWRGAMARLAPLRRCIAPDFMGMGYTRVAPGQAMTPEAQVAMLVALLDQLGVASVDVIANDSGGTVAQLLMLQHRERVRTLLLSNCDVETDSPPAALLPVIDLARQGRFVDDWLGRWYDDRVLARSPEGIGGMCYADPAHPTDSAIDTYFGPLLATARRTEAAHAYAIALERNALAGSAAALQRCDVPTRVVWGMADTIFSPASPDWLDAQLGHSRGVRRLEGYKLFWPEERPDLIAEEARAVWSAWSPARTTAALR